MATQDSKPLVHITKRSLAFVRGQDLRLVPCDQIVCGVSVLHELFVGAVAAPPWDGLELSEPWQNVTCPECIIAMDSDE